MSRAQEIILFIVGLGFEVFSFFNIDTGNITEDSVVLLITLLFGLIGGAFFMGISATRLFLRSKGKL